MEGMHEHPWEGKIEYISQVDQGWMEIRTGGIRQGVEGVLLKQMT